MAQALRPAALYPWFTSVTALKGIGPNVAKALTKLLTPVQALDDEERHIPLVRDLLFHLPNGIIDRRTIIPVGVLKKGDYATVEVEVTEHVPPPRIKRRLPYHVVTRDATGLLILTFFHVKGDYLARQLPVGSKRLICGTIDMYDGQVTIAHPDVIADPARASEVVRLAPAYALTAGISQRMLARATEQALARVSPLPEWQDAALMKEKHWPSFTGALAALHSPQDMEAMLPGSPVRARLAYDELLGNQLALALSRRIEQRQSSYKVPFSAPVAEKLKKALPFTFTAGQQKVLDELLGDLASGQRMVRLLQGDVGSGKTILAFALMAQVAEAGFQAALMAPTDLLARQHLQTLQPLVDALGLSIALISGKSKKAEREKIQTQVAAGDIQLVIGTHALFQDEVDFKELALVVVDEQHRFGVAQRVKLTGKGKAPHLLQMTATPIPRSLSMTLYGDMEISALTERPPGRKEINTRAVPFARMAEVIDGLGRVLKSGEKIYWVCPLIEGKSEADADTAKLDLTAAEDRYEELKRIFPGKVGLVHGRMKLAERECVMQDFAFGELQLLVATTVVEVGVNVPEATVMVIEHAERFGLAQLHQLRGRVGRSDKESRCVLLYHDPLSQLAKSRLSILRETNDGFVIAEEDLRLRGEGDVLGTRQTGLPDFLLADMSHHMNLITVARDDAKHILHQDPDLLSARGKALRLLLALFEYDAAMAQLKAV